MYKKEEIVDFFTLIETFDEKFKLAFDLLEEGKFFSRRYRGMNYEIHEYEKTYVAPAYDGHVFVMKGVLMHNGSITISEHDVTIEDFLNWDAWFKNHQDQVNHLRNA